MSKKLKSDINNKYSLISRWSEPEEFKFYENGNEIDLKTNKIIKNDKDKNNLNDK